MTTIASRLVTILPDLSPAAPGSRRYPPQVRSLRDLLDHCSVIEIDPSGFKVQHGFGQRADRSPDIAPRVAAGLGENKLTEQRGSDRELLAKLLTVAADDAPTGERDAADDDGHVDSSTHGRPESVLRITVEVPLRGGDDSRPCACGGAK